MIRINSVKLSQRHCSEIKRRRKLVITLHLMNAASYARIYRGQCRITGSSFNLLLTADDLGFDDVYIYIFFNKLADNPVNINIALCSLKMYRNADTYPTVRAHSVIYRKIK